MTRFLVAVAMLLPLAAPAKAAPRVRFEVEKDRLRISIGDQPFADYVFRDDKVLRPYFARLHAPGGVQVTRNHPPTPGKDAVDHATMHPGLWLAFGELGGGDFWRNKGRVEHVEFVQKPTGGEGVGRFAVRNRYQNGDKVVCTETARFAIHALPGEYLLVWDSVFRSETGAAFGDQEEMGLGVRVATPLTVKSEGRIVNSDGQVNEKQVWGKEADWCSYGSTSAGVVLMPHPGNFRRSWFHARDYGLLVANPFGRQAFTRGPASKVEVRKGEDFRLRFGVLLHSGKADGAAAFKEYQKLASD